MSLVPRSGVPGRAGIALLAVLGVAVLAVATQPWWLAPLVARDLANAAGRGVAIGSMRVGLTAELEPVVRFDALRIENAAWADTDRPFAELGEAVALLSWRSIAQGRPVVERLILRDGEVDLQRQADGLRNWRLRHPEHRGPGRYKVLALQAERVGLRFRHDGIELDLVARATANADAATDAAALPTRIELQGAWRTLPFTATVATGPVLTFMETGNTFPIDGRLAAGGARFEAAGRAGDLFRAPVFDARVLFAGDALAPFRAFIGPRHDGQAKRPFRVEGRLEANAGAFVLSSARARIGASDLAGDLAWARKDRPMLRASLQSDSADLADLRWLAGRAPVAAARKRVAEEVDEGGFWRSTDAAVQVEVRRLHAVELPWLRSLAFEAALADSVLAVSKFDAGVAVAGHATGKLNVDLRTRPYGVETDLSLRGLRLETLIAAPSDETRVTGLLQVDAQLKGRGDSAAALRGSASGSVRASVRGGSMPGLLDAKIGLQGGRVLRSWIAGSDRVAIRCAAATVDLRGGAGRVHSLVLDTERTRTTGSGRIDFGAETMDLLLTPEAKEGGLLVLDRSIRLHGSVRKPERSLMPRPQGAAGPVGACPA